MAKSWVVGFLGDENHELIDGIIPAKLERILSNWVAGRHRQDATRPQQPVRSYAKLKCTYVRLRIFFILTDRVSGLSFTDITLCGGG
ncbi:uncharacterized protein PgNI_09494 [Pyricularia grisea]|uniref:Uncharacterized protein n=1 Tax=Pyricularia grisea TaxID=148305 RepID=A0A6P8AR64_PYRGI|nr:uncharacterized protein PgNI_09494 [Pyricularia grisea]TLD04616.1 hypothetical protein PgNI_09494 [Pyricularia grisea]